jgi:hypothetical protein
MEDFLMIPKMKDILGKHSIINSTLLKIIFSSLVFLLVFLFLYGQNYGEKQKVRLDYLLLTLALDMQTQIESQISLIEETKGNQNLTDSERTRQINSILKPIVSSTDIKRYRINDDTKNNNMWNPTAIQANDMQIINLVVLYYDIASGVTVENQNQLLADESFLQELLNTNLGDLQIKDKVGTKLPVYYQDKIVGYLVVLSEEVNSLGISFTETSLVIILGLILALLIMFIVKRNMEQIQQYLCKFSGIIEQDSQQNQEEVLRKLPELEPVLKRITAYTDDLKKMNLQLEISRSRINKILEDKK